MFTIQNQNIEDHSKRGKEAIHSGHFMVSHFEAEEQDDEDELAVPLPEVTETKDTFDVVEVKTIRTKENPIVKVNHQQLAIDTSLSKLFQCMSLAYRQKLTSPKWNRFRGIRLRWKDKIRLNNVIWRCWHMQFIKKQNTLICQFASPLDVDTHNKPEAVVLEGKYWKRKLAACTAEYKKWRMFFRNHALGHTPKDTPEMLNDMDMLSWNSQSTDNMHMMVDEDYMGLMSDTLFSTISNQPFVFPDSREIARAGLADFIQPSLGPLQPNLDDYMDTFEPLQELISGKLPTVPEEHMNEFKHNMPWFYPEMDLSSAASTAVTSPSQLMDQFQSTQQLHNIVNDKPMPMSDTRQPIMQMLSPYDSNMMLPPADAFNTRQPPQEQPPPYQPQATISKSSKPVKAVSPTHTKVVTNSQVFSKSLDNVYQNYPQMNDASNVLPRIEDALHIQETPLQVNTPQIQNFKLHQTSNTNSSAQIYKFSAPSTSAVSKFAIQKEEKADNMLRAGTIKVKQRSRSNTREPLKRPPLMSAISDTQLVTSTKSVLLTQLLANNLSNPSDNSNTIFPRSQPLNVSQEQHPCPLRIKEESSPVPILPQPNSTTATLIITAPVNNTVQSNFSDPLIISSLSNSSSPVLDTNSSQGLNSPTSSQGSLGSPNRENPHRDQRRAGHIHAEQKRRYNIKNGFDMIHSLIPHLHQNPNAKLSKAAMLQKGAEYIRQLRAERSQLKEEMDSLRQQIETLNTSISNCQSLLPATGAPVSRRKDSKMQEMFDEYVRVRTMENWKFWIFSLLFKPLLASFNNFVSTSSMEDLYRSTLLWIEQHCTLVDLRPVVLNSFRYLCTRTDILSEPERLPEEARQAVASNNPSRL